MPQSPKKTFRSRFSGAQGKYFAAPAPSKKSNPSPRTPIKDSQVERGWDPVATWYDKLVGENGSDYHQKVILPTALKLLQAQADEKVIDVCCGQGVLLKALMEIKLSGYCGVDASDRLIASAQQRYSLEKYATFVVADACAESAKWADGSYDAAACVMAVHDVPDEAALFTNMANSLKSGGRAVFVFMHPCFRIPKFTHWGWETDQKIQFRRVDRYASAVEIEIQTHPGKDSTDQTIFYHRPMSQILTALGRAGLAVVACEELMSHRRSQAGGAFSRAEHKAAEEFPLFIALKAVKI